MDCDTEHKIDKIIGPLEFHNAHALVEKCIPLAERGGVNLVSDPSQGKQEANYFMYLFIDSQDDECKNQFVKEQVGIHSLLLLDDLSYVNDIPVYDKYEDNYDVEDIFFNSIVG
jgi:hypothetical protein